MQHLRVICPPDLTDAVLAIVETEPGVTHIVLHRGVALAPAGDAIQADITREATNDVLERLEALGLQHSGAITLEPLETVISDAAVTAEREAPGDPNDAVVWRELLARTHDESTLSLTFLTLLTIACLLSAVGVATDSPVTIVGAMVVGPEFGPLAALSVALVRKQYRLARRSLVALTIGFPIAMGITMLAVFLWEWFGWLTLESFAEIDQVDFIYQVGPFSLVVALLAGAAGMLSLVTAKSAALIGVFISVTTVPAAGYAVVAATVGQWRVAMESVGQLGVNLIGIVVAGIAVLMLWPHNRTDATLATLLLGRAKRS